MNKICPICKKEFSKNYHYSKSYWKRQKYCSSKCFGKSKFGIKLSDEWKKHLSEAQKRIGNKPPSNRGKHRSEETKRKISLARKGKPSPLKGRPGRKHSPETRMKLSLALRGEKSSLWKGGISKQKYSERKLEYRRIEYRLWREAVFARDNFTCQKCWERGTYLESHHIKNHNKYPELRFAIDNGITFCKKCHKEFHKIFGRQDNNSEQLNQFLICF
jgi:hypothetical protein